MVVKRKNNSGFVPIIILIIILVIGLIVSRIMISQKTIKTSTTPTSSPQVTPSPSPTNIPTKTHLPTIKPKASPTPTKTAASTSKPSVAPTNINQSTPTPDPIISNKNGSVTITSPNGGEQFKVGDIMHITWTFTGPLTNFILDYSNGPYSLNSIDQAYYGSGSYDWKITLGQGPETQFKIRAGGVNLNGQFVSDYSDDYFTITR